MTSGLLGTCMYFTGVEVSWDKRASMDKTRQVHNPRFLVLEEKDRYSISVEEFPLEISNIRY